MMIDNTLQDSMLMCGTDTLTLNLYIANIVSFKVFCFNRQIKNSLLGTIFVYSIERFKRDLLFIFKKKKIYWSPLTCTGGGKKKTSQIRGEEKKPLIFLHFQIIWQVQDMTHFLYFDSQVFIHFISRCRST